MAFLQTAILAALAFALITGAADRTRYQIKWDADIAKFFHGHDRTAIETALLGDHLRNFHLLTDLSETPFFDTFKANLTLPCQFWSVEDACAEQQCVVSAIQPDTLGKHIPPKWTGEVLDNIEYADLAKVGGGWEDVDSAELWVEPDLVNAPQMGYFSIKQNPESFTGYGGEDAHKIWRAIYDENCWLDREVLTETAGLKSSPDVERPPVMTASTARLHPQVPLQKATSREAPVQPTRAMAKDESSIPTLGESLQQSAQAVAESVRDLGSASVEAISSAVQNNPKPENLASTLEQPTITTLDRMPNEPADICCEERLMYRLISGIHAEIAAHLSAYFPVDVASDEFHPNIHLFYERLGNYPERIDSIYFTFSILMSALNSSSGFLKAEQLIIGNPEEETRTQKLLHQFLESDVVTKVGFNHSELFNGPYAVPLMEGLQKNFRNVSRLLNCVQCKRCRLHAKISVLGIGTALKLLFHGRVSGAPPKLQRNEFVALIQAASKFGDALRIVRNMEEIRQRRAMAMFVFTVTMGLLSIATAILGAVWTGRITLPPHRLHSAAIQVKDRALYFFRMARRAIQPVPSASEVAASDESAGSVGVTSGIEAQSHGRLTAHRGLRGTLASWALRLFQLSAHPAAHDMDLLSEASADEAIGLAHAAVGEAGVTSESVAAHNSIVGPEADHQEHEKDHVQSAEAGPDTGATSSDSEGPRRRVAA